MKLSLTSKKKKLPNLVLMGKTFLKLSRNYFCFCRNDLSLHLRKKYECRWIFTRYSLSINCGITITNLLTTTAQVTLSLITR